MFVISQLAVWRGGGVAENGEEDVVARVWGAGKIFRTTLKNVPKRRSAEAASSGFQNQFQDQFPTRRPVSYRRV